MSSEIRILAIDHGTRRIGLALSDPTGTIASGIGTVGHTTDLIDRLVDLIRLHSVTRIVVGLPLTLRGEAGDSATAVRAFVAALAARLASEDLPVPVDELDERFTSRIASQTIRDLGVGREKRKQKGKVDEIAAVVLLQDYLSMSH
jgi:putative holliday junction resolvase